MQNDTHAHQPRTSTSEANILVIRKMIKENHRLITEGCDCCRVMTAVMRRGYITCNTQEEEEQARMNWQ